MTWCHRGDRLEIAAELLMTPKLFPSLISSKRIKASVSRFLWGGGNLKKEREGIEDKDEDEKSPGWSLSASRDSY